MHTEHDILVGNSALHQFIVDCELRRIFLDPDFAVLFDVLS